MSKTNPYAGMAITVTPVITREYAMLITEPDGTVVDRKHFSTQDEADTAAAILRKWFGIDTPTETPREEAV